MSKIISTQSSIHDQEGVERVEAYITLAEGEYWKALIDSDCGHVTKEQTLLLIQLDYIDEQVHTVYVRLHPSKTSEYHQSVKFLIDDFLNGFEHVDSETAKATREGEIARIQQKLVEKQSELQQYMSQPELIDADIKANEPPAEQTQAALPVQYEAVGTDVKAAIQTQKVSMLMSPTLTETGIIQIQSAMEDHKNTALKRSDWLQKRTSELTTVIGELTPYFKEQTALAMAKTQEIREHIDSIMSGLGTLNLYVLKDVECRTLTKGESANEDIPLTITQQVLYMDEELAVFDQVGEDFDFKKQENFFDALASNSQLVNQIFPSQRCVVGMKTTRQNHHYADKGYTILQVERFEQENQMTFLLVRDGDNLHLVLSPDLWHQSTSRLFPSTDEMEKPFRGFNGHDITYNDINYTRSVKQFNKVALMYKRLLILLCGLDHKLQLLGCFYQGEPSLEFVSLSFQEKHFNFIHDADGKGLLMDGTRPETYEHWLAKLNKNISKHSHVAVLWKDLFDVDCIPAAYQKDSRWHRCQSDRRLLYTPAEQNVCHGPVESSGEMLFLPLTLKGENDQGVNRTVTGRLDLSYAMNQRTVQQASLICLDEFDVKKAKWYLHDRASRTKHYRFLKMLKSAIYIVEAIEKDEATPRTLLLNAMIDGDIATEQEALPILRHGVAKWKLANHQKTLDEVIHHPKLFKELTNLIYTLSGKGSDLTEHIKETETKLGRTVLRIALQPNGKYVSFSTALKEERDDRLLEHQWVMKTVYEPQKRSIKASKPTPSYLKAHEATYTTQYELEAELLAPYIEPTVKCFKTPTQKENVFSQLLDAQHIKTHISNLVNDTTAFQVIRERYQYIRESDNSKSVARLSFFFPIGLSLERNRFHYVGISCPAEQLLTWIAYFHSEKTVKTVMHQYADKYIQHELKYDILKKWTDENRDNSIFEVLQLGRMPVELYQGSDLVAFNEVKNETCEEGFDYSYEKTITRNFYKDKDVRLYLEPSIAQSGIDSAFDITPPDDHLPCYIEYSEVEDNQDARLLADIYPIEPQQDKPHQNNNIHANRHYFSTVKAANNSIHQHTNTIWENDELYLIKYTVTEVETRTNKERPTIKSFDLAEGEPIKW